MPRRYWSPAEDQTLRRLVGQYGTGNWNSIADKLQGRSGKRCSDRWLNQLDPRINRDPFSEEEKERLLAAHRKHGTKWTAIVKEFPGRTNGQVKNNWHAIMAKRQRQRQRERSKLTRASSSTIVLPSPSRVNGTINSTSTLGDIHEEHGSKMDTSAHPSMDTSAHPSIEQHRKEATLIDFLGVSGDASRKLHY